MTQYEITFNTSNGGETKQLVTAENRDMAVAIATVATITMLEEMTRTFGSLFGVEFGEATEGFAMGLDDGEATITVVEVG